PHDGGEAPHHQRVAGGVGGAAQEGGMSERQQAGVGQQQIEGAGEQGVAHDLHDEDRVGAHGRQQRDEDREDDIACQLTVHFSFPKRPAGRSRRTMTMMMNTTVFEASGQKTLVRPSIMPRPRPVMMEPMMEPIPPITTTANTTMIRLEPINGETCMTGAASTPAKPASATPKP